LLIGVQAGAAPNPTAPPVDKWSRCAANDADTSIAACTALIRSGQDSAANLAAAYFNRGNALYRKSQFERANGGAGDGFGGKPLDHAIADYGQAIRIWPDAPEPYVNRGIAYYEKGEYDRAIADDDQAVRLKPDLAEAYNNRSLAYYKKRDYERATRDFDQTIRLNKNYGNAMINRSLGSWEAPPGGPAIASDQNAAGDEPGSQDR
jgi:tetratricopeptide (TPR) repeat protein